MNLFIYIAGRWRWGPEDNPDLERMAKEQEDERKWHEFFLSAGHIPFSPLHWSVLYEQHVKLAADEWIERECDIIRGHDSTESAIAMRPGWCELLPENPRPIWYPEGIWVKASEGATKERTTAIECEWPVIECIHGHQAVLDEVERLSGAAGVTA